MQGNSQGQLPMALKLLDADDEDGIIIWTEWVEFFTQAGATGRHSLALKLLAEIADNT